MKTLFNMKTLFKFHKILPKKQFSILNTNFSQNNNQNLKQILYSKNLKEIDSIIQILKEIPEETDDIINEYLDKDYLNHAMEIFHHHKKISMKTFKRIEKSIEKTFVYYYLKEYLENKQDFQQLFEFLIYENIFILNKCLNILCENKKFEETFRIFEHFDFDKKLDLEDLNQRILKRYLIEKYGKLNLKTNTQYNLGSFLKFYQNKIKYSYFNEDLMLPYGEKFFKINLEEVKVNFIENVEDLKNKIENLKNSEYFGLDNEWKPDLNKELEIFNKSKISLMQISNFNEICIIDMMKIEQDENLIEILRKLFINKKLITNSFNNDLMRFNTNLKNFFINECEILDIKHLYNDSQFEKIKSLQYLSQEVFNKEICKKEQCSNWEIRPLRNRQIHYAASDSYIIVKLYENLIKQK